MILEFLLLGGVFVGKKILAGLEEGPKPPEVTISLPKPENMTTMSRFFEARSEQFKDISSHENEPENEITEFEKQVDQSLAISATSIGLAGAGALLFPPLSVLSAGTVLYANVPIFKAANESLFEERRVRMSVLDAAVISACLASGLYLTGSILSFLISFSQKTVLKTEDHTKKSLINVFAEQSHVVWLYVDGAEVESSIDVLNAGDIIVVNTGESIPVDGIISNGNGLIDQHLLTGEAQPVEKEAGDQVFASSMLLSGKLHIQVEKTGSDTVAAQIGEILNNTIDFKEALSARWEELADKTALPMGLVALSAWPILGLSGAAGVLNAHFGYDMKIIAPISMLNFVNLASQNGVLVKDARALEWLSKVDTIVFDKTGTLTQNEPTVGNIYTLHGMSENELLLYAAAAEYKQTHPIALAILKEANKRQLEWSQIEEARYEVGYGLKVSLADNLIRIGSARFMALEGIDIPTEIMPIQDLSHEQGHSLVYVAINDRLGGAIELLPTIRPEARQIISTLRERNMSTYIISGDHEKPTKELAKELGVDHYFAETLPQKKAELIEHLQEQGKFVCFVGDGINDSIALKKANVSISLRGAASIATDTANIVLMDQSLKQLIPLFDLTQEFKSNMQRNFAITIVPAALNIIGAFVFNFGVTTAILFDYLGLTTGIFHSMWPVIKDQRKESTEKATPDHTAVDLKKKNSIVPLSEHEQT